MTNASKTLPSARSFWRRWEARDIAPLVSLAVLALFFHFAARSFFTPSTAIQILKQGSVLSIVAVGLTFVLICAEIDLAVGYLALWTACYCGYLFDQRAAAGDADPAAMTTALLLCIPLLSTLAMGLTAGVLTVWARLPSFIITLAMMNVAYGASRYLTQSETFNLPPILLTLGNRGIELPLPGAMRAIEVPFSAMLAGAVFLIGHLVLQHTRFGRYVYMTGGNREAARLAGVRTGRIVVACLAISSLTAGLGGLLNAGRMNSISLDQNATLLLDAVACVVLGGTSLFGGEGGMGKTLIGVLTFCVLQVGLNKIDRIDDLARPLLMGAVLLVALVINGTLGKRRKSYS